MPFYETLYHNLCQQGKLLKNEYRSGSGLHAHHIIPRHAGGSDDAANLTYLTLREHQIAHFLLWKIYRNVNDLRSMSMLGAELSVQYRRQIGIFCRDNQIGIHNPSHADKRSMGGKINGGLMVELQKGIHDPQKRSEYASIGGKASWLSGNNPAFLYWASAEGRSQRAKLGSRSQPKKPATNGIETRKFFTEEDRDHFLSTHPDWRKGCHWSANRGRRGQVSKQRKAVEIDGVVYASLSHAAIAVDVAPATVLNRCRSDKWPSWNYQ